MSDPSGRCKDVSVYDGVRSARGGTLMACVLSEGRHLWSYSRPLAH